MNILHNTLVAVDTQILIWGGIRKSLPGNPPVDPRDADKEKRSRILIHELTQAKARMVIPAVSVAELLCPIDFQYHGNFLAILSQHFDCPSFDIRDTSLAARLWKQHRNLPPDQQLRRTVLKADMQIVASAWNRGVRIFYSDDTGCRQLAMYAGMNAQPLPTHALSLFTESELRDNDVASAPPPSAAPPERKERGGDLD